MALVTQYASRKVLLVERVILSVIKTFPSLATQASSTTTSPAVVPVFVRTTTVESEADYILNSFKNDARSTFGETLET